MVKRSKGAAAETWVYGYDLNNRLVTAVDSATDGGAATARVTYVYDAIGNRIERLHWNGSITVDERFAQDGWDTSKPGAVGNENFDVVLDLNGTNGLVNRRLYGDGQDDVIAKQTAGGVVTWYLTDRLGSVQSLLDNSGVSVGTLTYSAFGSTTVNVGATDRYQSTGREWDAALGLQFNRDRMYISSSGRWMSEDTANRQNEITSISGATTPTYDSNGNMTGDETGKLFVYDAWNRLVAVKNSGGTVLKTYGYDARNHRVLETVSGTTTDLYYSAGWQVLEERVGGVTRVSNVWSPVYVDAMIARDRPIFRNHRSCPIPSCSARL